MKLANYEERLFHGFYRRSLADVPRTLILIHYIVYYDYTNKLGGKEIWFWP